MLNENNCLYSDQVSIVTFAWCENAT